MAKGAYKYGGGKSMSSSKARLTGSKGRMSSAHGTNGESKDHNMGRLTGGYLIGKNVRTFHHNGIQRYSGEKNDTRHADQPSGHKNLATGASERNDPKK